MENQQQFQPQRGPQENLSGKSWKVIVVILILAALVVAGFFYFLNNSSNEQVNKEEDAEKEFAVTVDELGLAQIPEGFPKNIPMQEGSKVIQNYEADTTDGRKQSVRKFSSQQTVATALQTYIQFFESEGWQVLSEDRLTSPVQMKYGSDTLKILVVRNSTDSETIVDLTLTQHPKQ